MHNGTKANLIKSVACTKEQSRLQAFSWTDVLHTQLIQDVQEVEVG